MLSSFVTVDNVYFYFTLWVFLWFAIFHWKLTPYSREEQKQMAWGGAAGGVFIAAQLTRPSFWNPPSVFGRTDGFPYLTLEDALFGAFFLGLVVVIVQCLSGRHLERERYKSVEREGKVVVLIVTLAFGLMMGMFGASGLFASIVALIAGAMAMLYYRRGLLEVMVMGSFLTLALYALLVLSYVALLMLGGVDVDALGKKVSPLYTTHGPAGVGGLLALWALAFGGFFAPAFAFFRNRSFVPNQVEFPSRTT